MNNKCPNCGCDPHTEPYCMETTHCPMCGYIFQRNADARKIALLNNMLEYLDNYGVEFEDIGVYDHTEDEEAYNICLGYIVELVGSDGDASFFENVLGFTKKELIGEGMEWVYK